MSPPSNWFLDLAETAGRESLAGEGEVRDRAVRTLVAASQDRDPRVSARATELLIRYVRTGRTESFWEALSAILEQDPPQTIPLLLELIRSPFERWQRSIALSELAKLQKGKCLPLLKELLRDPLLRATAAWSMGALARHSREATLIELLKKEGEAVRDPDELAPLARALREIGSEEMRPILAPWVDRLTGWDRTDAAWFVQGIGPMRAVERLVELEVLPKMPDESFLTHAMASAQDSPCPASRMLVNAAFSDTAGRVIVNASGLNEPIRYDRVLQGFAIAKPGLFKPENIREDDARLVRFEHHGRPYGFTPRDLDGWYDLRPLVESVNRALEDDDIPERFVGLENGPQLAVFVVAVPDRLREAARELYLALEPDPDAARRLWMEGQKPAAEKQGK